MIEDVPAPYVTELTNRWNGYAAALVNGSASLIHTCELILNITLDKCSVALGHPKNPKPGVIFVDDVMKLEYPAP